MCGISGIIGSDVTRRIAAAQISIEHRGRDDEGVFISSPFGAGQQKIALGHRRLSIIDTSSAGHQPMFTEDGRYAILLNGEIYNYLEIRKGLAASGELFATGTDTEVLLKAFRRWGSGCLDRLNGMFAFAIWDDREKELTLARDRAGIKPMYYCRAGQSFAFASEIKAILAMKLVEPELDEEALNQFLTFLWPVPPHTLFKNIWQLMPGHFLRWKGGEFTTHEWWDLDFLSESRELDENRWIEETRATLGRVVGLEMVADVPLGAFLSGGIDSSALVALMSARTDRKISTYTSAISAEDLKFDIIPDDVRWSRKVAELLPIDYHETTLTPDVADLLPKLVWHQDAPVIDMAIPTYLISKQSRETQTVMLSGMGGDEVFAGYPRQLAMKYAGLIDWIPTAVRRPLMSAIDTGISGLGAGRLATPVRNARKFARSAGNDFEERYLGFGTYFTDAMKRDLYSYEIGGRMAGFDAYRHHREHFDHCRDASPLNRMLYIDFKTFMPALNLDTTDKQSMAANLEVRAPYLNKELLDLSCRIPSSLKIKGFQRKYVLKRAAESLLPREIIWRKKAGFGAPIRSWLRGPLKPMVDDLLSESRVKRRGLFKPQAVARVIADYNTGRGDLALHVFALLTLELWFEQFFDNAR